MTQSVRTKAGPLLVTGAAGMLAQDLIPLLDAAGRDLVLADVNPAADNRCLRLDITDRHALADAAAQHRPSWIINCAAYTNVDRAESDYAGALQVNALGTGNLAYAAKQTGCRLLHVSTDYVFGGRESEAAGRRPWKEDDPLCPCGLYGYSKALGEELLRAILPAEQLIIVRTSWLHGSHGPNFVHTMLRLAKEQRVMRVVNDQLGSPTWTGWLAQTLCALVDGNAQGIYHASSRGNISWFDFACEIFRQSAAAVEVQPMSSAELNRPAPRPPYSTLDTTRLETFLGVPCPDWKQTLGRHLRELGAVKEEQ